ncbi:MAG TPA: N-acetylmuramoyl-L-alanine amidase [bacterium]|nr:N-acetylmuramoyl-L-alanine amidase [bacterium]
MANKTVCISAGHQPGFDPGAMSNGLVEADLTIKIADKVVEILRKHSVPTLYVPNNISLFSTITWINDRNKQIDGCAVDIHINSAKGTGWEAYYYGDGNNSSEKLSQFMVDALEAETSLPSRGVKSEYTTNRGKLGFVHDTVPVASLIECGFIDRDADRKLLSTEEGLFQIAKGVARGILGYIGVLWRPELITEKDPPPPVESVSNPVETPPDPVESPDDPNPPSDPSPDVPDGGQHEKSPSLQSVLSLFTDFLHRLWEYINFFIRK